MTPSDQTTDNTKQPSNSSSLSEMEPQLEQPGSILQLWQEVLSSPITIVIIVLFLLYTLFTPTIKTLLLLNEI